MYEFVLNILSNHSLNHPLLANLADTKSLWFMDYILDLLGMAFLCAPGLKHYAILVAHLNFFYSHNDGRALKSVQYFNFSQVT